MAFTLKETTKRDLKIKGVSVANNIIYVDGEMVDLVDILAKSFGENVIFDLAGTEKTEEELEIADSPTSDEE